MIQFMVHGEIGLSKAARPVRQPELSTAFARTPERPSLTLSLSLWFLPTSATRPRATPQHSTGRSGKQLSVVQPSLPVGLRSVQPVSGKCPRAHPPPCLFCHPCSHTQGLPAWRPGLPGTWQAALPNYPFPPFPVHLKEAQTKAKSSKLFAS